MQQIRNEFEFQRAKRVVANCPTDILKRTLANPIHANDPNQRALNVEFIELVKLELERRQLCTK